MPQRRAHIALMHLLKGHGQQQPLGLVILTAIDQETIDRYAQRYVEYKNIYRNETAGDS